VFSNGPKDLSHLPPYHSLRALVKHFEASTRTRGASTMLYEEADAAGSLAD
jgi:hypothetical protein